MSANYSAFWDLNEGDVLANVNGKRTAKILGKGKRRNRNGFQVEITTPEGGWFDFLTWNQIEQRFPNKLENNRYTLTLEGLTEADLAAVQELLAGRNFKTFKAA